MLRTLIVGRANLAPQPASRRDAVRTPVPPQPPRLRGLLRNLRRMAAPLPKA